MQVIIPSHKKLVAVSLLSCHDTGVQWHQDVLSDVSLCHDAIIRSLAVHLQFQFWVTPSDSSNMSFVNTDEEVCWCHIKCTDHFSILGPEQRHRHPGRRQSDRDEERRGAGGLHRRDRHLGYVQPSVHRQTARCLLLRSEAMGEISQAAFSHQCRSLPLEYAATRSLSKIRR